MTKEINPKELLRGYPVPKGEIYGFGQYDAPEDSKIRELFYYWVETIGAEFDNRLVSYQNANECSFDRGHLFNIRENSPFKPVGLIMLKSGGFVMISELQDKKQTIISAITTGYNNRLDNFIVEDGQFFSNPFLHIEGVREGLGYLASIYNNGLENGSPLKSQWNEADEESILSATFAILDGIERYIYSQEL